MSEYWDLINYILNAVILVSNEHSFHKERNEIPRIETVKLLFALCREALEALYIIFPDFIPS